MQRITKPKRETDVGKMIIAWMIILFIPYLMNSLLENTYLINNSVTYNIIIFIFFFALIIIKKENKAKFSNMGIYAIYSVMHIVTILNNGISRTFTFFILELLALVVMLDFFPSFNFEKSDMQRMFNVFIVIGIVAGIFNALLNIPDFFRFWSNKNAYAGALSSVFGNKNTFGQFLFPICAISFFMLVNKFSYLNLICSVFLVYNIVTSYSKTSMLCLAVFAALYILLTADKHFFRYLLLILLMVWVAVELYNIPSINKYINTAFIYEDDTFTGRDVFWEIGVRAIQKKPWFGYGMGRGGELLFAVNNQEFHNSYIELAIAGGICKLLIFLWLFIDSIRKSIAVLRKNRIVGAFCISFIVTMMIYCMFESFQFFGRSLNSVFITFLVFALPRMLYRNTGNKIVQRSK